ncbi:hypothetical protein, partial [Micromonospora terminaliae]|uniref:hypothetical protein n=1 Tax=Micromonospora terminaliae TaxID=1914461 RepID=UPI001952C7AF
GPRLMGDVLNDSARKADSAPRRPAEPIPRRSAEEKQIAHIDVDIFVVHVSERRRRRHRPHWTAGG